MSRVACALLVGGALVACKASPSSTVLDAGFEDADVDASSAMDSGVDSGMPNVDDPPTVTAAHVSPTTAGACSTFSCIVDASSDPENAALTFRYRWTVNGVDVAGTGATLASTPVLGDVIGCAVIANDGANDSAELVATSATVADTAPTAGGATVPSRVRQGRELRCSLVDVHDDCSTPTETYAWTVDGVTVPGETGATLATELVPPGSAVRCSATIDDGSNAPVTFESADSVVTADRFEITGDLAGGRAGFSVDVAEDRDGDGFGEILVGAPSLTDATTSTTNAGGVFVVSGRDDALVVGMAEVRSGARGIAMAPAPGGYDLASMVCGSYFYPSGCPKAGVAGTETDGFLQGPNGPGLGSSVVAAGDVDGDGADDYFFASPYALVQNVWQGRNYLVSGAHASTTSLLDVGADPSMGFTVDGECGRRRNSGLALIDQIDGANGDLAGYRVAGHGDFDGDGLADLLVGAPNAGQKDQGSVYALFSGGSSAASRSVADVYARGCDPAHLLGMRGNAAGIVLNGPTVSFTSSSWGQRLAVIGDFDGDGYDDFAAAGGIAAYSPMIVRGRPTSLVVTRSDDFDPSVGRRILPGNFSIGSGGTSGQLVNGLALGGRGDANGDGFADLAFGVTDTRVSGRAFVLFGRAPEASVDIDVDPLSDADGFAILGNIAWDSNNDWIRIVGDVNGDGYDDVAVGSPFDAGTGRVFVVFGKPDHVAVDLAQVELGQGGFVIAGNANERLGQGIAGGDVDGDGLADVVVGAPEATVNGLSSAGRVVVRLGGDFSGAITAYGTTDDDALTGTSADDSLVGGWGDDVLTSGGGADVLYGGAGDDVLEADGTDFRRIRGGAGFDTLRFATGSGDVVLADVRMRVEDVERFELAASQTLTVSRLSVLRASGSSNELYVTGAASSRLATLAGDSWVYVGRSTRDGVEYVDLVLDRARLHVDARIGTSIPPTVSTATLAIAENAAAGAVVGTVAATDPDGAMVQFALGASEVTGAFMIDPTTGVVRVLDASAFDHETHDDLFVDVVTTDEDMLVTTRRVVVSVTDVNEAPAFEAASLAFALEEGSGDDEAIGGAAAFDVDAGDVLTYTLSGTDAARFTVDPVLGTLYWPVTSVLDFETSPVLTLTVTATDAGGLSAAIPVTITVGDRDVLERTLATTFTTTDEGFDGPGGSGSTPYGNFTDFCLNYGSAADATWASSVPGIGGITAIVDADFGFALGGQLCMASSIAGTSGSFDATLPYDITFTLPDEVPDGGTVDLTSAYVLRSGASLTGVGPSFQATGRLAATQFAMTASFCANGACSDYGTKLNGTFTRTLASTADAFATASVDTAAGLVVGERSTAELDGLSMNWDEYLNIALTAAGLNPLTNSIEFTPVSGYEARVDYRLFEQRMGLAGQVTWDPRLTVDDLEATITFEDGTTTTFDLGGTASLVLPAGADLDLDGNVDVAIAIRPRTTFQVTTNIDGWFGFSTNIGQATITQTYGSHRTVSSFGPYVKVPCNLSGTGSPSCFPILTPSDVRTFEPEGFNVVRIVGAIDLAP